MPENKTLINDMTEGGVVRQLITFSLPFMLASFLQTLYSAVDMLVVGRFSGEVALSSVTVGTQLVTFYTMLGIGFAGALQIMVAQYVGAKDHNNIARAVGTGTIAIGVAAVVLGAIGIVFARPLLQLMNAPAEALEGAVAYMRICSGGLLLIYGYNVVASILRGMGDSKRPLIFIAIAAAVNIVLDLLLVGVFHMGAAGAAVATVAGQGISFLWSLFYLYRNRTRLGFEFHLTDLRVEGKMLKSMLRLGLPMALQSAAICLSAMYINAYINAYGVTASAITGVGSRLTAITGVVSMALATAMGTMVGQNMAAGRPDRVRKLVRTAFLLALAYALLLAIVCTLFPTQIFGLFNKSPDLLALAPGYMRILTIGFFAGVPMAAFNGVINGIGNSVMAMIIGLMDGVVARIGIALLCGVALGMGVRGFWLGDALAAYVTGIIGCIYYLSGKWMTFKLLKDR